MTVLNYIVYINPYCYKEVKIAQSKCNVLIWYSIFTPILSAETPGKLTPLEIFTLYQFLANP